jgi:hypothetical protein
MDNNIKESELNILYSYLDENMNELSDLELYIWTEFLKSIDEEFCKELENNINNEYNS